MVSKLKPTFITDEFVKAILDSIATGNKITLTTSIGSSTIYTDQQLNGINYQQTQGSSKNITAPLNSAVVKLDTNTIIIELDLTNENLNNDFQIATVLINGKYNGNDLLVGVVRFEAPELFPKYDPTTGSIYEIKSRVYLSLSNISNATIAVSNAGMATAKSVQDLRTYVDGAFNSDIARKSIDNIYNGNNTYNKKIIAPAGLQGNSDSSDKLQTARRIGGQPFDGTSDVTLPGVNATGNQDTTGNAASADILNTRAVTFTDFVDVAKNMVQYIGNWYMSGKAIANSPMTTNYATIQVVNGDGAGNGYIFFSSWPNNKTYIGYVNNGLIAKWSLITDDSTVVHNTGDETIAGNKTFTSPINGKTIKIELPNGTDLNNVTAYGSYSGYGTSFLNLPTSSELQFDMVVMQQGIFSSQIIISYTGDTSFVHYRSLVNGVWQPWKKMAIDTTVVHNTGNETVNGVKLFLQKIKGTIDRSDTSGLADKATKLATTHKIGGIDFDGTQDINLPGVNVNGNQDTTGNSASSSSPKSTGIDVNTDLNSLRSDGYYTFMAGSMINSPVYGWFSLTVTTIGAVNGNQVLIDSNTGNIWVRSWNKNNVYTEWKNTSFSEKVKLQTLPENYNVDGAKSGGNYTGTNGKLVGLPASPVWGTLEVIESAYGDIVQRFNVTSGSDVTFWQRRYIYGSDKWSDWKTF